MSVTLREQALRIALAEIGVTESPTGSNSGPRVNEYLASAGLGPGYPWCMAFVNWSYRQAGLDIEHPNEASVGFFEDWARKSGYLVSTPARGDIVCYRFDADNWPDHVGIVEDAGPTRIITVEGNTAIGNDANGGMVMRRTRGLSRCVFARIPGVVAGTTEEIFSMEPAKIARFLRWYITDRRAETKPEGLPSPIPDDVMSLVGLFADIHVQLGTPALVDTWLDYRELGGERPPQVPLAIPNAPLSRWWETAKRSRARIIAAVAPLSGQIAELERRLAEDGVSDAERDARVRELLDKAITELGGSS